MIVQIQDARWIFFAAFAVMLLATWLMSRQSRLFYTKDPLKRKFSGLEMEFPAKSFELQNLVNGIYLLPDAAKIVRAVRNQLLLDYLLFIPAAYGGIFVLCMHTATHLQTGFGQHLFAALGWVQIITFVLDYTENTYFWILVGKRNLYVPKPDPSQPEVISGSFRRMQVLEAFKWGLPLIAFVCCVAVMAYLWLSCQVSL